MGRFTTYCSDFLIKHHVNIFHDFSTLWIILFFHQLLCPNHHVNDNPSNHFRHINSVYILQVIFKIPSNYASLFIWQFSHVINAICNLLFSHPFYCSNVFQVWITVILVDRSSKQTTLGACVRKFYFCARKRRPRKFC